MDLEPIRQEIMANAEPYVRGINTAIANAERLRQELDRIGGEIRKAEALKGVGIELVTEEGLQRLNNAVYVLKVLNAEHEKSTRPGRQLGGTYGGYAGAQAVGPMLAENVYPGVGNAAQNMAQQLRDMEKFERINQMNLTLEENRQDTIGKAARLRQEESQRVKQMHLTLEENRQDEAAANAANAKAIRDRVTQIGSVRLAEIRNRDFMDQFRKQASFDEITERMAAGGRQSWRQGLEEQARIKAEVAAKAAAKAEKGESDAVTRGLHPYYLMHQFHTMWVEGGATITHAIRAGMAETSSMVAHGVQVGMASIGQQVAQLLHASLGIGGSIGSGIGGLGGAIGGGITRLGQARAQGIGGMIGAGVSGVGTAVTAGVIFGGPAAAATGFVAAANVLFEYVKMKVDTAMAAISTAFNMGITLAQTFGGTLVELGERFLTLGMNMEQARVSISAFAQDNGELFEDLLKLTREMPIYSFKELSDQMKTLVAEGIPVNQVIDVLKRLGDVAHGDAAVFHRAALAFGEMWAKGVVDAQRLRQLAPIGIGVEDLAKAKGVSRPEFMAQLHAGKIGIDTLTEAVNQLTEAGGRYAGQNTRQLDTVFGQWSRLKNLIDQGFGRIGETLLNKSGLKGIIGSVGDWIEDNFEGIESAVMAVFERIKAAFEVVANYMKGAWESVLAAFGKTGKSLEEALPSLDTIREFTKEILDTVTTLAKVLLVTIRAGLESFAAKLSNNMLSSALDMQYARVMNQGVASIDKALSALNFMQSGRFPQQGVTLGEFMVRPPTPANKIVPPPTYSPDAQKALQDWEKLTNEGVTPYDKLLRTIRIARELMVPPSAKPGWVGPIPEVGPGQIAAVQEGFAHNIFDLLSHRRNLADSLSAPAFAGSREATDIINRSSLQTQTFREKVIDLMEDLKIEAQQSKILREQANQLLQQLIDATPEGG